MNLKKNHYSRRALALLLTLVMCVGMIPTAFAAQQNSYHDPAEHWMQASGRTNELDANSVVTRETFKCGECGKATSFEVFRVPEYRIRDCRADISNRDQLSACHQRLISNIILNSVTTFMCSNTDCGHRHRTINRIRKS